MAGRHRQVETEVTLSGKRRTSTFIHRQTPGQTPEVHCAQMSLTVPRIRRWLAVAAIAATVVVAGAYFYARHRVQNALKQVPEKIGLGIQQSADGFTISRSDGSRTLFKIQASKAVQFKQGGRAELRDVAITLYGRDSSRYDQIYGSDFEYDPQSGDVVAKGEVQIDLEANPAGIASPDQATPKELKNPVHLRTSGLTFNQKTGNAFTSEKVDFRISQASGEYGER
jgi:lipopolysaccharide export system protein LptA